MITVERSVEIGRPPEVVVQALFEPGNMVHWTKGLDRLEIVGGELGRPGSKMLLYYIENGRETVMEDVLEQVEPGRRYVSRVSGKALEARVETTLEEITTGTRMSTKWSGSGKALVLKLLLRFMNGTIGRHMDGDLQAFKELVERYGPIFPASAPVEGKL